MKLRVWWIPQIPMNPFFIPVQSIGEAELILGTLAAYDKFQLDHNIKPDYASTGGIDEYDEEAKEWVCWYNEDGETISAYSHNDKLLEIEKMNGYS